MIGRLSVTVLAEDSVGYESECLGQHGISLLIDACNHADGTHTRVLMDVAQHPEPLLRNMELLGVDPASIDMIFLTHCHYDHTQGVSRIVRAVGKQGLPVLAHPDLFRPNFELVGGGSAEEAQARRHIGVPLGDYPQELESAGAELRLSSAPLEYSPGLWLSGEIPRTTAYEGLPSGLYTERITEQGAMVLPDPMLDDMSLYAVVQGKGVVVLSGCSHAGIVNSVRHARTVCGEPRVAAVMGGLHLIVARQDTIDATVSGLHEEGVEQVLAGHCTGFRAQAALYTSFAGSFSPLYTGLRVEW